MQLSVLFCGLCIIVAGRATGLRSRPFERQRDDSTSDGDNFDENRTFLRTFQRQKIQQRGTIWPLPQHVQYTNADLPISAHSLKFETASKCDVIKSAIVRYPKIMFPPLPPQPRVTRRRHEKKLRLLNENAASFTTLTVAVKGECERYPHLDMNESYALYVWKNGTGLLEADSIWGALRGFETFSQLVFSPSVGRYRIRTGTVRDWPRFAFRGILVDTSRHFLPVKYITETIELMAQNKFNVFHWHIVDAPSFPYESRTFPALSAKGAYSGRHVYKQADIAQIVEYARLRGVRVLAEFDTPGHATSWGYGQPNLLTKCYDKSGKLTEPALIDPTVDSTWDFLLALFSEILEVFPDQYLHLGGDEVGAWAQNCWLNNPAIQRFMRLWDFSKWEHVENYYFKNFLQILQRARPDLQYVVWNEVLDHHDRMPKDKTIAHVWNTLSDVENFTARGFRTIFSYSEHWYLNYISYGADWEKMYKVDPQNFNGTAEQKNLVVGGEACMWGEFVDSTNLIPRTWPRASAIGERLWSAEQVTKDPSSAAPRLEEHRCRMILRGHPAQPPNGPSFCQFEWGM